MFFNENQIIHIYVNVVQIIMLNQQTELKKILPKTIYNLHKPHIFSRVQITKSTDDY